MLQVQRPLHLDVLFWAGVSFTSSWEAELRYDTSLGTSVWPRVFTYHYYISASHVELVRRGGEETGGGRGQVESNAERISRS